MRPHQPTLLSYLDLGKVVLAHTDHYFSIGIGEVDNGFVKIPRKAVEFRLSPTLAPIVDIYKIACGGMHTLALSTHGHVFSFGCNDEFALGRGGDENVA